MKAFPGHPFLEEMMKALRDYALLIEKFFPLGRGSYCAIVNHKNKPVVQIYIFFMQLQTTSAFARYIIGHFSFWRNKTELAC